MLKIFNKNNIFNISKSKSIARFLNINALRIDDNDDYYDIEIRYNKKYKYFYEELVQIESNFTPCQICKGSGWIVDKNCKKLTNNFNYKLCNNCLGKGYI